MNAERDFAAGAPEFRLASHAISVSRLGHAWTVLAVGGAVALVAAGLSIFAVFFAWFAFRRVQRHWLEKAARPRAGTVRVTPGSLTIEREGESFAIETSRIVDCWFDGDTTDVFVATRRAMVSIWVADRKQADALSLALGVDPAQQLVGTTLTGRPLHGSRGFARHWRRFFNFLPAPFLVLFLLIPFVGALGPLLMLLTFLLTLALPAAVGLAYSALPPRVFMGRDGFLLMRLGRRKFIGYERVKSVQRAPSGITIALDRREVLVLPLAPLDAIRGYFILNPIDGWVRDPHKVHARREALVAQIETALLRFRDGESAELAGPRLLERGTRSIAEWRSALTRAGSPSYRDALLDAEQLVDIVENPQSSIDQRIGAAVALADWPDSDRNPRNLHEKRIHAAIASSANPRVRIALERAVDGTLDEDTYDAALRDEAAHAGLIQSPARSGSS